jgi:hypothetical protein
MLHGELEGNRRGREPEQQDTTRLLKAREVTAEREEGQPRGCCTEKGERTVGEEEEEEAAVLAARRSSSSLSLSL